MPAVQSFPVDSADDSEALHLRLVNVSLACGSQMWAKEYHTCGPGNHNVLFLLAVGLTGFLMPLLPHLSGSLVTSLCNMSELASLAVRSFGAWKFRVSNFFLINARNIKGLHAHIVGVSPLY